MNFEVGPAELDRDDTRGAPLLEGELRVRMQVATQRNQLRH